jgi:hypothetical protein
MTVAINQLAPQSSPLDKIATAVQIYRSIKGIGADSDEAKKREMELEMFKSQRDAMARRKDANSPESAQARAAAADLGFKYEPTDSADSIQSRYGESSNYYGKKFAEGEHRKTELAKLGMNKPDAKRNFDLLPPEKQEQIKDLAKSSGSKTSIKNEIDSALEILRSAQISEDQKVVTGQNLLKLLNSTQGQDAVGSEEVKRLASFLTFKKFNVTEPGSMFGRDLPDFIDQVALTSARLNQSIGKNGADIDRLYGRAPSVAGPIQLPEMQGKNSFSLVPPAMAGQSTSNNNGLPNLNDIQAELARRKAAKKPKGP